VYEVKRGGCEEEDLRGGNEEDAWGMWIEIPPLASGIDWMNGSFPIHPENFRVFY